jgi:uncharacterized protein GlcG (DUF336 family)
MNMRILAPTMLAVVLLGCTGVNAQSVRTERNISLALANEIAAAAVAECLAKGYDETATVVDRAGQVRAVQRSDNAPPHTLDSSRRKAYTSATMRLKTSQVFDLLQKKPDARYLYLVDGFLPVGGGVPIRVGDEVIGAVGAGGAPGADLDEQCAEAGIAKVKDKLK